MFKLVEVSVGTVPSCCGASIPLAFQGWTFSGFLSGFFFNFCLKIDIGIIYHIFQTC